MINCGLDKNKEYLNYTMTMKQLRQYEDNQQQLYLWQEYWKN